MSMMLLVGIGVLVAIIAGGAVLFFIISGSIKNSFNRVADRVVDKALTIGEKHIVQGVSTVGKMVGQEMVKSDPRRMMTEATKHAKDNAGELTVSKLMALMDISSEQATKTFQDLMKKHLCTEKKGPDETIYVFPAFKKKKKIKKCEYCNSQFDYNSVEDTCNGCGAKLIVDVTYD